MPNSILEKYATAQGWNDEAKLSLVHDYIKNQHDDSAYTDFLVERANDELAEDGDNSALIDANDDIPAIMGWNTSSQLFIALVYITNQNANDAFEDFLSTAAANENDAT